jgi:hypothetical protein
MAVLSSILALKTKWNQFIKANGKQLIRGDILNSLGHDLIDTIVSLFPPESKEGTFLDTSLDVNGCITIDHTFNTLTPIVTLRDPEGYLIFETNTSIQTPDTNTVKFTIVGPKAGIYNYSIRK